MPARQKTPLGHGVCLSLQYIFMDCESMLSCVTLTRLFCFLALWFEKEGDRNMILIMSGQKLPAGTLK